MLINVAEWRPDILEEHAEELESLWNRRLRAERSPLVDLVGLRRVDRRIEAHADALVLADDHALRFVERLLTGGDAASAAAGAFVVGCSDAPALVGRLLALLPGASGEVCGGVWAALQHRAGPALLAALATLPDADEDLRAGVFAVCAVHDPERALALGPESLIAAASPIARVLAWHGAGRLGALRVPAPAYARGFEDEVPAVRRAALEAAARGRHAPLLEHLRRVADNPDPLRLEEHVLLAVLADSTDAARVQALCRAPALGWERYRLLALWGRAAALALLLDVIRGSDVVEGALAGAAFYRITGVSTAGAARVPLVPTGTEPDDFTDLVHVCDGERAERAWSELHPRMGEGRWACGTDTDASAPEALPAQADLDSRWATELRARFASAAWSGRPAYDTFWGVSRD